MEREFVSLDQVIEQMESSHVAFLGPKGSGKSTTLREAYYRAQKSGKNAFCFDLKTMVAMDYSNYDGRGSYFFVDNAQMLRRHNSMNSFVGLINQGKVCLAFSSNVVESGGLSHFNCPLKCPKKVDFLPFTRSELQKFLSQNCPGQTYEHETMLPSVVTLCLLYQEGYECVVSEQIFHIVQKNVA